MSEALLIMTTAPASESADAIAAALVDRRQAACVQILGPMTSVYRWQDQVERSEERLLLIKTTAASWAQVEATIREFHSYQCPEIVAVPITAGSKSYLDWLAAQIDPQ